MGNLDRSKSHWDKPFSSGNTEFQAIFFTAVNFLIQFFFYLGECLTEAVTQG